MADVVGRLQKIRRETHIAQDLLEYAVEDVDGLECTSRTRTILNILQDKLCAIDGMQVSLLAELESKKMPQQSGNSSKGQQK